MTHPKKAMSARTAWASVAVVNARADTEIANRLATYGFDAARLDQDNTLLIAASASMSNQVAAVGQHLAASAQADAIEANVCTQTDAIAKVARVALDRPSLATLGLDRTLPKALDTFVTASLAIYDNALGQPAIAAQLAKYGYPADRLGAERDQVQQFIDARRAQEAAKGAAQQATAAQDKAMAALDEGDAGVQEDRQGGAQGHAAVAREARHPGAHHAHRGAAPRGSEGCRDPQGEGEEGAAPAGRGVIGPG